jgi:hypothetical protein
LLIVEFSLLSEQAELSADSDQVLGFHSTINNQNPPRSLSFRFSRFPMILQGFSPIPMAVAVE